MKLPFSLPFFSALYYILCPKVWQMPTFRGRGGKKKKEKEKEILLPLPFSGLWARLSLQGWTGVRKPKEPARKLAPRQQPPPPNRDGEIRVYM